MRSIDIVALLSVGVALALSRVDAPLRDARREAGPQRVGRLQAGRQQAGRRVRPGLALALVSALLTLNQLLVVIYIDRVHDGEVTFVSRWLPDGWFELPRFGVLDWLAAAWPAPEVLAPSLLRVPAVLELPFVVLAYVTMAGFLSPRLAHRLSRGGVLWAASLSFTAVFCLVEWHFNNPWTAGDLVLRVTSGLVTPLVVARFVLPDEKAGQTGSREACPDPVGLALFVVSAAALGHLVLVVYDTVLLYNLGRVDRHLAPAAVSATILLAARLTASRRSASATRSAFSHGPVDRDRSASGLVARLLTCGFALFFVPSLAVRYEVTFGSRPVAFTAVGVLGVATVLGARPSFAAMLRLISAAALAATLAWAVRSFPELIVAEGWTSVGWFPHTYESRLLVTGTTGILVVVGLGAVIDRVSMQSQGRGSEAPGPERLHPGASDPGLTIARHDGEERLHERLHGQGPHT